jgi:hypothetical protein
MGKVVDSDFLVGGDRSSQIDCLVIESALLTEDLQQQFINQGVLLPVVVLVAEQRPPTPPPNQV